MFCLPLKLPDRSAGSTYLTPLVNKEDNSSRTSSPFNFSSLLLFSCACAIKFFLTLSTTSSGFKATNFIGLPSFITINPFFSRLSRMSYVLDLGTSEILLNSPAVEVPRESNAVQTFASYKLRSNIFLSLLKNSSLIIIVHLQSFWCYDYLNVS